MARSLSFKLGRSTFEAEIRKIDRSKLYGRVQTQTFDANGAKCDLATLARDGHTLIPYGGTAAGYLNKDGLWVETGERKPVDVEGNELTEVPSSFDAPISLKKKASAEDLLDHPIRLAYLLVADEFPAPVRTSLDGGDIYAFDFSYRGGAIADPAFLLSDEDGDVWMLIGSHSDVEFVTFAQAAICAPVAEKDSEDDADAFDFDML
jgi:hypothetical protein